MSTSVAKLARSAHQPVGRWIRPEKRLAINLRDGFRCVYCCADLHGADPADCTLDHVVPKADGGSNDASNLVTACRACNCSRRDLPLNRYASKDARADIRRLTRRNLAPFLRLAKAFFAGEVGREELITR